jgi:hypothetical protein
MRSQRSLQGALVTVRRNLDRNAILSDENNVAQASPRVRRAAAASGTESPV